MGRRTKQSLKKRAPAHRVMVLKLRRRKNRIKAARHSHQVRARRRSGGKK